MELDLTVLLKDCPAGTKLYSPLFGEVELSKIHEEEAEYKIFIKVMPDEEELAFTKEGRFFHSYKGSECLLFPSKEVRDWGVFNCEYFIATGDQKQNKELQRRLMGKCLSTQPYEGDVIYKDSITGECNCFCKEDPCYDYILKNGKEIKLEEEPKFKVGDAITINGIKMSVYNGGDNTTDENGYCYRLALPEEINYWNEKVLHPVNRHYSQSKKKIVWWFNTGDEVLVKDDDDDFSWFYTLFSHYRRRAICRYATASGSFFETCLPYNDKTKHLVGTTEDFDIETLLE